MSIEQTHVIDLIGIEKESGKVTLQIIDHLEWSKEHIFLLQEKLNAYLSYLESGEIYESYPKAKGRPIEIQVTCKFPASAEAEDFISQAKVIINDAGFGFKCDYPDN